MRTLKNLSIIVGTVALLFGLGSCKKEDPIECCTFSYTYDNVEYSWTACDDGKLTYTYGDQTETDSWKGDYDNWAEIKGVMLGYGATCN